MIEGKQAPVRPRVLLFPGTTPLLLEEEIRTFVESRAHGNIAILGPTGSGKTTALEHLAATLPNRDSIVFLDRPTRNQLVETPSCLTIYTGFRPLTASSHLAVYELASWSQDDLIEYLLSVHRPRCASVLSRVRSEDHLLLGGWPELWRIVLDQLACDDSIPDVRRALHRHVEQLLSDTDLLERARSACLNVAVTPELSLTDAVVAIARPGFADRLVRLLHYPAVQRMLASERIAADLYSQADCDYLAKRLPRDLVEAAGRLLAADDRAVVRLHVLLAGPSWSHAMAVSLLHAAGESALLKGNCPSQLAGAYLSNVRWNGVQLMQSDLRETELIEADLRSANLEGANASKANLCQARLLGACLHQLHADEADLRGAVLTRVCGEGAKFVAAKLEQAVFRRSQLPKAGSVESSLTAAVFSDAVLRDADFTRAILKDADFSGADLTRAVLSGLCLRNAHWEGVRFAEAQMEGCDLEYMTLPAADFEGANLQGALLTGSTMFGANFRGACLREAGLADIEWEGADLRDADLRGASFHMGSTRSGLVGSTIPCEGSKTGFYTDDYDEQSYKAPEEIRKANLCGADLRGAILDGVDFYLVDLRGALYDDKDADHLRRCGAILEARV